MNLNISLVSEGKRKQLFNHLLNEFRNSKVNIATPNYMSGGGGAMHQQISGNVSGSAPSTMKNSKKKASSIEKKSTSVTINGGYDTMKKQALKKGILVRSNYL